MAQKEKRRILLKYSALTNLSFSSSGATGKHYQACNLLCFSVIEV